MAVWKWLQVQSLLTSDDKGCCEAVARNILKGFYFPWLDVLGYKRDGLHCYKKAQMSCSWVNLINIFHEAW